jgi:hypothetical protein
MLGMLGQVFERPPVIEIPDGLDLIKSNASGSGVTLLQSANKTLAHTLAYGRSGLLVDFPVTGGIVTADAKITGQLMPTITTYDPANIINWRTIMVGSRTVLSMVVIAEGWPFYDDGFEIKTALQFRVLSLEPDRKDTNHPDTNWRYRVDIWREPQPTQWTAGADLPQTFKNYMLRDTQYPTDPNGAYLTEIPFMFVGSHNNDVNVDQPPLFDLADLNIAHYRNSADYEEAVYMMGQPTYWFSGLTEQWVKNVLNGKVQLGSRGGVMLPQQGAAGLLQPAENTMVKEAMEQKENQMVALGAKLVQKQSVQRTATEAGQEKFVENSILSTSAKNVSEAYTWALRWSAYMNADIGSLEEANKTGDIEYKLNDDYSMMTLDWQSRQQLIKEWQAGGIAFEEMRAVLRKAGIATLDDDAARDTITKQQDEETQRMIELANATRPAPANNAPKQ